MMLSPLLLLKLPDISWNVVCLVVDDGDDCWSEEFEGVAVERFSVSGNGGSWWSSKVVKLSLAILVDGGMGIGGMIFPVVLFAFFAGANPSVRLSNESWHPVSCDLIGNNAVVYFPGSSFGFVGGFWSSVDEFMCCKCWEMFRNTINYVKLTSFNHVVDRCKQKLNNNRTS